MRDHIFSLSLSLLLVGILTPAVLLIVHGKDLTVSILPYTVPLVIAGAALLAWTRTEKAPTEPGQPV